MKKRRKCIVSIWYSITSCTICVASLQGSIHKFKIWLFMPKYDTLCRSTIFFFFCLYIELNSLTHKHTHSISWNHYWINKWLWLRKASFLERRQCIKYTFVFGMFHHFNGTHNPYNKIILFLQLWKHSMLAILVNILDVFAIIA